MTVHDVTKPYTAGIGNDMKRCVKRWFDVMRCDVTFIVLSEFQTARCRKLTLLKRCLPYFKRAEQICFLETCCQKTKVVRACLRVVDITVCYVIVVPLLRCISTRPIFIFKLFSQQTFVSKKHLFGEHF